MLEAIASALAALLCLVGKPMLLISPKFSSCKQIMWLWCGDQTWGVALGSCVHVMGLLHSLALREAGFVATMD